MTAQPEGVAPNATREEGSGMDDIARAAGGDDGGTTMFADRIGLVGAESIRESLAEEVGCMGMAGSSPWQEKSKQRFSRAVRSWLRSEDGSTLC